MKMQLVRHFSAHPEVNKLVKTDTYELKVSEVYKQGKKKKFHRGLFINWSWMKTLIHIRNLILRVQM